MFEDEELFLELFKENVLRILLKRVVAGCRSAMEICMITDTYHPTVDGIVRYLDYLIPELLRRGHRVTVLCPKIALFDYSHLERPGLTIIPAWTTPFKVNAYFFAFPNRHFLRALKNSDFVILHSLMPLGVFGGLLARLFRKKVGLFCHHDERVILQKILKLKPSLVRLCFRLIRGFYRKFVQLFFHATERFKRKLLFFGVEDKQIIRTRFAIDLEKFHPKATLNLRQRYGIPQNAIIATYLGRLSIEKNVETIIRALDIAMSQVPNLFAVIVGTGPDEDKILQQHRRNNERFIFTGFVPDSELQSHYAFSDLFVTPTLNESSCFTVFEAMACQTPVITSRKDHDPEIIHLENALLINNVLNAHEIANSVLLLANNPKLRTKIALQGYQLISSFHWQDHCQLFLAGLQKHLEIEPIKRPLVRIRRLLRRRSQKCISN